MIANILSFDGGGIRGILELMQLIELEKQIKLIHGDSILDHFQYFSGTSTGSIIAVLLSIGYTGSDILSLYTMHGDKIFNRQFLRFGILRSKYDDDYLNMILTKYSQNKTLIDTSGIILIPTYNITKKKKYLFKTNTSKNDISQNYKLSDVMRTSCSAPSYFDCYILNDEAYIDGGLVINNPALMSLIEVLKINHIENKKYSNINLISFSSGRIEKNISQREMNGGLLKNVDDIIDIMLTEQAKLVDYTIEQFYLLYKILKNKELGIYTRIESSIIKSSGKIDDVSKKNIQNMIYDGEYSAQLNKNKMKIFIQNLKD